MTAAAAPGTERAQKVFQDQDIVFLLVYVREAHPGEYYPAHTTLEQKKRDATDLATQEDIHYSVLIDDLEGIIHLYVIDKDGRVAFRIFVESKQ
jgi:hypothetical protein